MLLQNSTLQKMNYGFTLIYFCITCIFFWYFFKFTCTFTKDDWTFHSLLWFLHDLQVLCLSCLCELLGQNDTIPLAVQPHVTSSITDTIGRLWKGIVASDWLNTSLSLQCLGKLILLSSYLLLSLDNDVLDKVSQLYLKYIFYVIHNCYHILKIFLYMSSPGKYYCSVLIVSFKMYNQYFIILNKFTMLSYFYPHSVDS